MEKTIEKKHFDRRMKRCFKNKTILANVLKELIPEYKNLSIPKISKLIEPENNSLHIKGLRKKKYFDKSNYIVYDTLFLSMLPDSKESIEVIINIESQSRYYTGYALMDRAVLYLCNLFLKQFEIRNENFDYNKIKSIYSVWFVLEKPNKIKNDVFNYQLKSDEDNYTKLNLIMVYNNRKENNYNNSIMGLIRYILFSDDKNKVKKLQEKHNIILDKEDIQMFSYYDVISSYHQNNGRIEGVKEGVKEGIKEGIKEGRIESAIAFVKSGTPLENVISILQLTSDEISSLHHKLSLRENKK